MMVVIIALTMVELFFPSTSLRPGCRARSTCRGNCKIEEEPNFDIAAHARYRRSQSWIGFAAANIAEIRSPRSFRSMWSASHQVRLPR
jgi:hypothetical protein